MWPGIAVLLNMTAGASDSIYTRAAGIPTYGIDAMFDDLDDGRAHGRDERIHTKVFAEELEFIYRLIQESRSNTAKLKSSRNVFSVMPQLERP